MKQKKIKTIIVDDELRALNRMKILLNHFPTIDVVEQTTDAINCLELILAHKPDLVFIDVEMPGKTGLEIADEIKRNNLLTKVVFVTSYDHYAVKAIKTEAFDYLLKPVNIDELKKTIDRLNAKIYANLSARELEIIRLIAKGDNSKEIGEKLHISRHTVDTHRRTILEKTNCTNAAELISYAIKGGVV